MPKFRLARDPVFYTNLVAAVVMFIAAFGVNLSVDAQGAINAVALALAGLLTAWRVSDGQLALVVSLFKALIALGLAFGLHLTPEQQTVAILLIQAVGVGFVRTQVGASVPPPASTAQPVALTSEAAANKLRT